MKAAVYARYSCDNQREESIEGQLRDIRAYCDKNDIDIVATYIDRAYSAKTDNRPDFQQMIRDAARESFDIIVVWKLDRFARDRYDSAKYKARLKKYNVKVVSVMEHIPEGADGILMESILEGMAEYFSADLAEKVIRGHMENAHKCMYNGGKPAFGYIIKEMQYVPDPIYAPVVHEIFKMYDAGKTMKECAAFLKEKGAGQDRRIDISFINRILHNRKYIGEYQYRDVVVPDGIPALVPRELFDNVQEKMKKNSRAPARHKAEDNYILTTKLFCGSCGAMMVGECGTSSTKGRTYHYYRCVNTKRHKTCNAKHKSVPKKPLEDAVIRAIMARIMDDSFVDALADAVIKLQSQESSLLPALRKQLHDTEKSIANMLKAIEMGIINESTKHRFDELEAAKKTIEIQIAQEELSHPHFTHEDVIYWLCRFRKTNTDVLEERQRLVDSFVNSIYIYDDDILITFNYKDGSEKISIEALKSSDSKSVSVPKSL